LDVAPQWLISETLVVKILRYKYFCIMNLYIWVQVAFIICLLMHVKGYFFLELGSKGGDEYSHYLWKYDLISLWRTKARIMQATYSLGCALWDQIGHKPTLIFGPFVGSFSNTEELRTCEHYQ
jgi:hypothetical protein